MGENSFSSYRFISIAVNRVQMSCRLEEQCFLLACAYGDHSVLQPLNIHIQQFYHQCYRLGKDASYSTPSYNILPQLLLSYHLVQNNPFPPFLLQYSSSSNSLYRLLMILSGCRFPILCQFLLNFKFQPCPCFVFTKVALLPHF